MQIYWWDQKTWPLEVGISIILLRRKIMNIWSLPCPPCLSTVKISAMDLSLKTYYMYSLTLPQSLGDTPFWSPEPPGPVILWGLSTGTRCWSSSSHFRINLIFLIIRIKWTPYWPNLKGTIYRKQTWQICQKLANLAIAYISVHNLLHV